MHPVDSLCQFLLSAAVRAIGFTAELWGEGFLLLTAEIQAGWKTSGTSASRTVCRARGRLPALATSTSLFLPQALRQFRMPAAGALVISDRQPAVRVHLSRVDFDHRPAIRTARQ